jgi:hypothetical protein
VALWWNHFGTRVPFSDFQSGLTLSLSSSGGGLPGRPDSKESGRPFYFAHNFLAAISLLPANSFCIGSFFKIGD